MQMKGIPTFCYLGAFLVWQKMTKQDRILHFSAFCKKAKQCLLLKNHAGRTTSELLRGFSQKSTAYDHATKSCVST